MRSSSTLGMGVASGSNTQGEFNAPAPCVTVSSGPRDGYDPVSEAMKISAETERRELEKGLRVTRFLRETKKKVQRRGAASSDRKPELAPKARAKSSFESAVNEVI
jgi:hypothetical protein